MPDAQPSEPQPVYIANGTAGVVATLVRVIAGLTTEKTLTLFVLAALGWLLFTTFQSAAADKVNMQRMYDDARERDRQHCDVREDKIARDRDAENDKMRNWYSALVEGQRRHEAEQREKDRLQYAEMARIIAAKLQARPPADGE